MRLRSVFVKAFIAAALVVPLAAITSAAPASATGSGSCSASGSTVVCTSAASPTPAVVGITSSGTVVNSMGQAATTGLTGANINKPIVGIATTLDGNGYWLVSSDGGVFAMAGAPFYGSMGGTHLNKPIVGIAATPDGNGYWLVASDGGIFAFGDAQFYGSTGGPAISVSAGASARLASCSVTVGGITATASAGTSCTITFGTRLNSPVVGMAATPDGKGYWLVASDGGIFSFGDAAFYGSMGGHPLNSPVVGMAATPDGNGYWLVASDGGVFAFGDAVFFGAAHSPVPNDSAVAVGATFGGPDPHATVVYRSGFVDQPFGNGRSGTRIFLTLANEPIVAAVVNWIG